MTQPIKTATREEAQSAQEQATTVESIVKSAPEIPTVATLATIAAAMTRKYRRPISAVAQPNPSLLAGLRVRVGDDTYESSVAGQLAQLAAAV